MRHPCSKGLGENDPEMMWLTTAQTRMKPPSDQVMPTDVVQTTQVDVLLGDNLAGRKNIAQHGAEYLDDLDA